jgi:serine/threonine protein kinase
MQLHCTRPNCPAPLNNVPDLPSPLTQKYCSACRMELILRGRYLPVSVLGQGGFGTAFLARDSDSPTKRPCVVKLFQPPVTLTADQMVTAQRLFATEAEVLERLGRDHPQIPNLYAYFSLLITSPLTRKTEELFYLVQEFIDGEDLEKILNRDGKFSEAETENVLRAMLGVLDFVHSQGAIHRDVKPSNIMKRQDGRLFLLDFGAVKEVTAPTATSLQSGPTGIYTAEYAPPEQIMNSIVDATSDLYALAATCVVLLTNKASHEMRDSASNSWQWQSHASVSPALAQVLNTMLAARPSDRYPSAKAALAALDGHQSVKPLPQVVPVPVPPVPVPPSLPPLSLVQILSNAAFIGTEGGLLGIAMFSLLGTTLVGGGVWLAMLAGLGFLQLQRTIEKWDFLIIAGLTLAAVVMFAPLNKIVGDEAAMIFVIAIMCGGAVVAIAVLFRLIFKLLSRIM